MYAFLKADLDFVIAQARKPDPDNHSDKPLNADDILGEPAHLTPSNHRIGGPTRFVGGSTASVALISTPTPTPFWHPASPSTIVVAHVGDTRIILCNTATGLAKPITTNHHPNSPVEGTRLRRYAATFVTDSFGEERMSGLANTRAFGDMRSKRIGVSAEPEILRIELAPAEYSFMVLVSDGVSGTLNDQEIVDVVKEAKTPEQGARDVVSFATEVSKEGDNATCLVVRLGGWERRSEGGMGSMATKEVRDFRKRDALDPRRGRT
jgi:protein phosphatase PTC6